MLFAHCYTRYVNFTLLIVAELSSQLMIVPIADTVGRHLILSFGLLLSGTACLACASTSNSVARSVLAMFGKYGCTGGQAAHCGRWHAAVPFLMISQPSVFVKSDVYH